VCLETSARHRNLQKGNKYLLTLFIRNNSIAKYVVFFTRKIHFFTETAKRTKQSMLLSWKDSAWFTCKKSAVLLISINYLSFYFLFRTICQCLKLTETPTRFTVRTCVYSSSSSSTTRLSTMTSSRSSSTFSHE